MGRYYTALLWPGFGRILGCFLYSSFNEFEIHRQLCLQLIRVIPGAQVKLNRIIGSRSQVCRFLKQCRVLPSFSYIKARLVKATGVIFLLGVGSFVCYKLFKKYKRKLSSCWKSRKRRKISRTKSDENCKTFSFFGTEFLDRKHLLCDSDCNSECSSDLQADTVSSSSSTSVVSGDLSGYSTDTESSDCEVEMGNLHSHIDPVFYNVHSGVQFGDYIQSNSPLHVSPKTGLFHSQSFEIINMPEKLKRPRTLNIKPIIVNDLSDGTTTDSYFEDNEKMFISSISPSNSEPYSYKSNRRKEPDGLSDSLTFSPFSFPSSPLFRDSESCQDSAPELDSPMSDCRMHLDGSMKANFSPSSLQDKHTKAGIFNFQGDSMSDQGICHSQLSLTRDQSYDSLSSDVIDISAKEDKDIGTSTTSSLDRIQRELHQVKEDVLDLDLDIVHLKLRKRVAPVEAPTKSVSLPDVSLPEEVSLNKYVNSAMYIFHRHKTRLHQKGLLDIPKYAPRAHSVGPLGTDRIFYSDMDQWSGSDIDASGSLVTIPSSESDFGDEFCLVGDNSYTPQTDPESSDWNRDPSFGSLLRYRHRRTLYQPRFLNSGNVYDTHSPSIGSRSSDDPSSDEPIGIYIEDSIEFDISDAGSKSSKLVSDEENALEWDEEFEPFSSVNTVHSEDNSSFSTISQESIVLKRHISEENIVHQSSVESKSQDTPRPSDEEISPSNPHSDRSFSDSADQGQELSPQDQNLPDFKWTNSLNQDLSEMKPSSSCDNYLKNGNTLEESDESPDAIPSEPSTPVDNHCNLENQASATSLTHFNIEDKCQIIEYAEREWCATTARAETILRGYSEIPRLFDCTCLRKIRGDNYCILRATLYQVLRLKISIFSQFNHSSSLVMEHLHECFNKKHYWLNEWIFNHRLAQFKESILFTMQDCIQTIHHMSQQQFETVDEGSVTLEDMFNMQPETDIKLMEAVKILMMLRLLQLHSDSASGKNVPNSVRLILAKEVSPETFMRKHLNHFGEGSTIKEQKSLFLLGHTLGVTLRIIRPSHYSKESFITCYPDDQVGIWPEVLLISEDDYNFSVAVP